ncbi:MAG: hypothetical protein ACLRT5_03165 [Lachnospiraceae bacterium]
MHGAAAAGQTDSGSPADFCRACGMAWCAPWEEKELLGEALSRFAGQVQEQHKLWL